MTREEAYEFITQSIKTDVDMAKIADAINILEQEPTKNDLAVETEHCIPRSYVYTLLKDIKSDVDDGYGFQYEERVNEVKELPTVYPKSDKPTQMIDESNFSQKQYKADTDCAYDCGKSVLNKIRAEIMELDKKVCQQFLIEDVDKEVHHTYQECLKILDKYSAEVEE